MPKFKPTKGGSIMKNIIVYYQKDFNPYAKYTGNFKKTHVKVFEGVINDDQDQETVFRTFNDNETNPLSYNNKTNKVCFIGKDKMGTGVEFQEAIKRDEVGCYHTSMSVGDIVSIDGNIYLCLDTGWKLFYKEQEAA